MKKYIEALENCKSDIKSKFDNMLTNFNKDSNYFKNTLIKELNGKVAVLYMQIDDEEMRQKWTQIREQYLSIRDRT